MSVKVETKVPKDIRVYKESVLGPFTFRQVICIGVALVTDIVFYKFLCGPLHMSLNTMIYFLIFADVPIMAFSVDSQGVPMEQYFKNVVLRSFITPRYRRTKKVLNESAERKALSSKEQKKLNKRMKKILKEQPDLTPYK